MFWEFVGFSAAFLTMFGFMPQLIKIYRTKSVKDISLVCILQFTLGIILWLAYGLHLKNAVLILANGVSLVILLAALVLFFKYEAKA